MISAFPFSATERFVSNHTIKRAIAIIRLDSHSYRLYSCMQLELYCTNPPHEYFELAKSRYDLYLSDFILQHTSLQSS